MRGTNFPISHEVTVSTTVLGGVGTVRLDTRDKMKIIIPNGLSRSITKSFIKATIGSQVVESSTEVTFAPPTIHLISPIKGAKESEVTLIGENFHPIATFNKVTVNNVGAQVLTASKKSLKIKIPGVLGPGSYTIGIENGIAAATKFEVIP